MTLRAPLLLAIATAGCAEPGGEPPFPAHSELPFPNARWVEGNGGPIDANGGPIDANGGPIDANARRLDGVDSRTLGVNDLLANPLPEKTDAGIAAMTRQGWYLPETTDLFVEGYPASFTGVDRCLALDAGATIAEWRVAASRRVERDDGVYVESGFVEVRAGTDWVAPAVDAALYLPARAAPALALIAGTASARPVLFRLRVRGELPVRDPTDLLAPTVDRIGGAMYRKQLVAVAMCLPDPADAAVAAWIPIGSVTIGDAYAFDVAGSPQSAGLPDGAAITALAPWLRFKGYIGRDPGDTSAKAEMYYTGGLVTRGDPALEPRLVCVAAAPPSTFGLPPAEGTTSEVVPVAELNARVAIVFANAMDVPVGGGATGLVGMTVNGSKIRVSLAARAGCTLRLPGALTAANGADVAVDWNPSSIELATPYKLDALSGLVTAHDDLDVFVSRNATACGTDGWRTAAWLEAAPPDDGLGVPARAVLAEIRTQRCDGVVLAAPVAPHLGRFTSWPGLRAAPRVDYWVTAWAEGDVARCGDKIYDREFEHATCPEDDPLAETPLPQIEVELGQGAG